MTDYFLLEVFSHELDIGGSNDVQNREFALAFQFLDYPVLLSYAKSSKSPSTSIIKFACGKSCILQEDLEEIKYVLNKVPLYISLFHISSLPRPNLLASGSTPLFISEPLTPPRNRDSFTLSPEPYQLTPGLASAVVREVILRDSAGRAQALARISCRLTFYGPQVPTMGTGAASSKLSGSTSTSPTGVPPSLFYSNEGSYAVGNQGIKGSVGSYNLQEGSDPLDTISYQPDHAALHSSLEGRMTQPQPAMYYSTKIDEEQYKPEPTHAVIPAPSISNRPHTARAAWAKHPLAVTHDAKDVARKSLDGPTATFAKAAAKVAEKGSGFKKGVAKNDKASLDAALHVLRTKPPTLPLIQALLRYSKYGNNMDLYINGRSSLLKNAPISDAAFNRGKSKPHLPHPSPANRNPFSDRYHAWQPLPPQPGKSIRHRAKFVQQGGRMATREALIDEQDGQLGDDQEEAEERGSLEDTAHKVEQQQQQGAARPRDPPGSGTTTRQLQHRPHDQHQTRPQDVSARLEEGLLFSHKQKHPHGHLSATHMLSQQAGDSVKKPHQQKMAGLPSVNAAPVPASAAMAPEVNPAAAMAAAGAATLQSGLHMSSVVLWEVMSLVMMRSVLSTAVGAMSNQMTSMAQQIIGQAVQPVVQQQYGNLASGMPWQGSGHPGQVHQQMFATPLQQQQQHMSQQMSVQNPMQQQQQQQAWGPLPSGYPIMVAGPGGGLVPLGSYPQTQQQQQQPDVETSGSQPASQADLLAAKNVIGNYGLDMAAAAAPQAAAAPPKITRTPTMRVMIGGKPQQNNATGTDATSSAYVPAINSRNTHKPTLSPVPSEDAESSGSAESVESAMSGVPPLTGFKDEKEPLSTKSSTLKAESSGGWMRSTSFAVGGAAAATRSSIMSTVSEYLPDFEEEEDVEEEEGMPKEAPNHHTAKASAAKPDAKTDPLHAPADQMSDISTDSSIVSEQKMELKPLPPSFVRPPRAVMQQSTKEEVLSATSEEYSDYDYDHEDAASPQPLPSVAQRQVTSRVNIPPALGSTTMDEIDDILDSTMEETPTGGIVARGTTNQGAVGKFFGRGATADEEEEVEDDDVSFFSDPESSIGEESRKGQQPKGKTGVVHKTVKPPQTVAKQSQKAAAKAQSSSGSSLGLSSTSSEEAVSSSLSRSPSRSLPPGSRRIHRQETERSSLSILPLEEEDQYDVEGASIDFDLDDEDIAAQLSMDINSASTTPQRPKTAAGKQAASSSFRKPAQQPQTRQQTQLQHSITSEEMGMTTADLEEALASENDESEEYGSGAGTRGGGAYQQSTGYGYTRAQSARYNDNSSYNGGYGSQYDNYGYDSRAAAPTSYGGKSGYGGGRQGSSGYSGAVGSSSYQRTYSTRY